MTNTNTITGPKYGATRDMPWNVMGGHLKTTHQTDLDKALKAAGMDYDVEVWDTQAVDPLSGRTIANEKGRQIVRPTPDGMKVVGQTGTRFTPIQNRDAFAIARDLCGDFGATIDGLGDFRHGGASVIALDLGNPMEVRRGKRGPVDTTGLYLLGRNFHDGQGALSFALTSVRMACTNVLPAAFREAESTWKVSHTPNAVERQKLVHAMIREAVGFREAFTVQAQAMVDQKLTDQEFAKIVANLFPVKDDATGKVADRKRETQAVLVDLYRTSPTLEGIQGTVWGGYNAVTEYLDHFRPVKGNELVARAEGQIDGPNVRVKRNIWRMFAAA
jgi:phage/plasmid-like protein (TIGR03299 family)